MERVFFMPDYQCNNPFHRIQDIIWQVVAVLSTLALAYVILKQIFPAVHWPF
jgi:hypothetical protein